MSIPVTHYMRPDGRKVYKEITGAPEEVERLAHICIEKGAEFTLRKCYNAGDKDACSYIITKFCEAIDAKDNDLLERPKCQLCETRGQVIDRARASSTISNWYCQRCLVEVTVI